MKYAIRIVDGATGIPRLFAVSSCGHSFVINRLRQLANGSIEEGSSDWVFVTEWDKNRTIWPENVTPPTYVQWHYFDKPTWVDRAMY